MQNIIQMINVFICMLRGETERDRDRERENILISPVNHKCFIIIC